MKRSAILQFLSAEIKMMRRNGCANRLNGWYSTGHFIKTHGRLWKPCPELPKSVRPGTAKQCFKDAALLAMRRPDLIYCEGYGLSIFPVLHAWCVDQSGKVVDPTWTGNGIYAREYFGVAILTDYLTEALLQQKHYCLIDAWEQRWPMLTAPVASWRHPIMDKKL